MTSVPSTVIADILVAATVGASGGTNDWAIYKSMQPDNPDAVVTVYDSGGQSPNPRWKLDYPSVQILVRGKENGYDALYAKAVAIQTALLGYPSATIGADRLVMVNQVGGITLIGYDKKRRPEISLNYALIVEPGTSGTYRDPL